MPARRWKKWPDRGRLFSLSRRLLRRIEIRAGVTLQTERVSCRMLCVRSCLPRAGVPASERLLCEFWSRLLGGRAGKQSLCVCCSSFLLGYSLRAPGTDPRSSASFAHVCCFRLTTGVLTACLLFWNLTSCSTRRCGSATRPSPNAPRPGPFLRTPFWSQGSFPPRGPRESLARTAEKTSLPLREKVVSRVCPGVRLRAALSRSPRAHGGTAVLCAPGNRRHRWRTGRGRTRRRVVARR